MPRHCLPLSRLAKTRTDVSLPDGYASPPGYHSKLNGWWQSAPQDELAMTSGMEVEPSGFTWRQDAVHPSGASVGCSSTSNAT